MQNACRILMQIIEDAISRIILMHDKDSAFITGQYLLLRYKRTIVKPRPSLGTLQARPRKHSIQAFQ